jgi:ribonuclease VapC
MVIDTSALLAILEGEPEAERFAAAIADASAPVLSAATLLEATLVVEGRKGPDGGRDLDLLLYQLGIDIAPLSVEQAQIARAAWRRFGKGRHPAALNYGDCFSYALAKAVGQPLLFKGADFSQTDVDAAVWRA